MRVLSVFGGLAFAMDPTYGDFFSFFLYRFNALSSRRFSFWFL